MKKPKKKFDIWGKEVTAENVNGIKCTVGGVPSYIIGNDTENLVVAAVIESGGSEEYVLVGKKSYGTDICLECNIAELLKNELKDGSFIYPKFETTSGAVMFTERDGKRFYLLVKTGSGHVGFPKGHVEYGETEEESAKREVFEETGLSFIKYGGFRTEYTFTTFENTEKRGIFFLGKYDCTEIKAQEDEIFGEWLLPYEEAYEKLNWEQDKAVLAAAEKYIREN